VLVSRVTVRGRAGAASGFRDGIRCGRNNCRFTAIDVDQPGRDGAERNALVLTGTDSTVYQGSLTANRYPYTYIDLGTDNLIRNAELEPYGSNHGAYVTSEASGSELRVNRIHNGILDRSTDQTRTWNNEYV
jgi:hypothetical protein